uniref:Retrotransposon Copia-like N-terminal domain-containing protein n=1 Tax=Ananas comosus var. bracteatus TaxID=296719 RepID=A0A6V7QVB5_ANACO
MADQKKTVEISPSYKLSSSDNPGTPLVSYSLTGSNYSTWARAMKNALQAKNKLGFFDGTLKKPDTSASEASHWTICNSMVIAWIFNSLDKSLQGSVAYAEDAKDMWDDLKDRFSQGNAPRVFQLKTELSLLRQDGLSVASYYTKLKTLWDELDDYSGTPACTCAAARDYVKKKETEKLYQFLMGLNAETFGTVRSQILNSDPLPTLSKAYSMVTQEERQRMVANGRDDRVDAAAFFANSSGKGSAKPTQGHRLKCDHCQKIGHDRESCWELNGYPENWEPRRGSRGRRGGRSAGGVHDAGRSSQQWTTRLVVIAHSAQAIDPLQSSTQMTPSFTNEQYQQLLALLNYQRKSPEQMSGKNFTHKDTVDWILDTGASMHMTGRLEYLNQPKRVEASHPIQLPNGRTVQAKMTGRNLTSKKPIGVGELRGGVYHLGRMAPVSAQKGWKLYDLDTQEVFVSRDVVFNEGKFAGFEADNESQPVVPLVFEEADAVNPISIDGPAAQPCPVPLVRSSTNELAYVPTKLQLADAFTKALGRDRFRFLLGKLGVIDIHAPT